MAILRYDEIMRDAKANMIARQNKVTDFNEGSVIHTILDTISRLTERAYVSIRQKYNELLVMLPYSMFGMEKKDGLHATGKVVFKMNSAKSVSVIIPKGTAVMGNGLRFLTTEAGSISAGELESGLISVSSEHVGVKYNLGSFAIDTIESVIDSSITDVYNQQPISGGTDEELDSDFETRFKERLNGLSGTNSSAIKAAVMDVPGVKSFSIQSHRPPEKNIYSATIYVDGGAGNTPEEVLSAVRLAVEGDGSEQNPGHLAPGVNVRVLACTPVEINVAMTVKVSGKEETDASQEIDAVVRKYIDSLGAGDDMVLSNLVARIMDLDFAMDTAISEPASNHAVAMNQVAVPGTITIAIEEVE